MCPSPGFRHGIGVYIPRDGRNQVEKPCFRYTEQKNRASGALVSIPSELVSKRVWEGADGTLFEHDVYTVGMGDWVV